MPPRSANPFEVTKAVDLSNEEIRATFVDLPTAEGGFGAIIDPRSPVPHFVVGGKGGGRTHLMRHLSSDLQVISTSSKISKIKQDQYLGIYFRCSGLNASRFAGKRQASDTWASVFAYYMDLWLSRLLAEALLNISSATDDEWTEPEIEAVRESLRQSYDGELHRSEKSGLTGIIEELSFEIRSLDRAINNAALRQGLDVEIKAPPGRALFAMAHAVRQRLLPNVRITFLIDEFENFKLFQQRYVNTLVREKPEYCGFIIGSRTEGVKTFESLSAGEVNRAGSEFDITTLEEVYSNNKGVFKRFCTQVATSRLREYDPEAGGQQLRQMFGPVDDDWAVPFNMVPSENRPHMQRLQSVLKSATGSQRATDAICRQLSVPDDALEEKLRVLKFYQRWFAGATPSASIATSIRTDFEELADSPSFRETQVFRKHHRADMMAQLYVEADQKVPYAGFEQFVAMAGYLPRSLLVILKSSVRWSQFLGEVPIARGGTVSVRAQSEGARDAAEWFLRESVAGDGRGPTSELPVRRLGGFLRRMRMSDKPVEVSCASFSSDLQGLSPEAIANLRGCVAAGIVIEIGRGQIDRNSGAFHYKYQLSPIVAPYFDLPTSRRGVAKFGAAEMNAVFDTSVPDREFDRVVSSRLAGMNAPFVLTMEGQDVLFN